MPHGKREEGTVAKVVLCRVEVSTATQTNRTAVPKSFFGLLRNLEHMQDLQYECVDGYACDYMIGDYHCGHASDYGGRREGAAPKTIRCPTKLGIWLDSWDPASQATISTPTAHAAHPLFAI